MGAWGTRPDENVPKKRLYMHGNDYQDMLDTVQDLHHHRNGKERKGLLIRLRRPSDGKMVAQYGPGGSDQMHFPRGY